VFRIAKLGLYQNKYVAKKPQGVLEASNCKVLRLRAKERSWSTLLNQYSDKFGNHRK